MHRYINVSMDGFSCLKLVNVCIQRSTNAKTSGRASTVRAWTDRALLRAIALLASSENFVIFVSSATESTFRTIQY